MVHDKISSHTFVNIENGMLQMENSKRKKKTKKNETIKWMEMEKNPIIIKLRLRKDNAINNFSFCQTFELY